MGKRNFTPVYTKTFAEFLRKLRTDRGMLQADFARLLGLDYQQVQRWESGESIPWKSSCRIIAMACRIDKNLVYDVADLAKEEKRLKVHSTLISSEIRYRAESPECDEAWVKYHALRRNRAGRDEFVAGWNAAQEAMKQKILKGG